MNSNEILLVTIISSHVVAIVGMLTLYWSSRGTRPHVQRTSLWRKEPEAPTPPAPTELPPPPDLKALSRQGYFEFLSPEKQKLAEQMLQEEEDADDLDVLDELNPGAAAAVHNSGHFFGPREDVV